MENNIAKRLSFGEATRTGLQECALRDITQLINTSSSAPLDEITKYV